MWEIHAVFFPADELPDEFELLTVKDISEQEILTFVHNFFSRNFHFVFNGYFETLASNHNRNTRNGSNLIKIPSHSTNIAASSIKIQGAKFSNKLDNKLKRYPKPISLNLNSSTLAFHMLKAK